MLLYLISSADVVRPWSHLYVGSQVKLDTGVAVRAADVGIVSCSRSGQSDLCTKTDAGLRGSSEHGESQELLQGKGFLFPEFGRSRG